MHENASKVWYAHTFREFVQLHVDSCARGHFYRLFGVFFFCYILSAFVEKLRYSPSPYLCGAKYSPRPYSTRDRDVAASRADVARLCYHFTTFATLAAPPIKDPSTPNIGRKGNMPSRFTIGNIRFFVVFFLVVVFFNFMPKPILVFAAQTAAATAQSRISRGNTS